MRQVRVNVSGDSAEDRMLALPFDVYGPNGEPLGHGTASPNEPKTIELPEIAERMPRVHVVATRPSGEQLQNSTVLTDGYNEVTLEVGWTSPHEWLRWVTPFRSISHLPRYEAEPLPGEPRKIGPVWMTLWSLRHGRWRSEDLTPQDQLRSKGVRQVTLRLPEWPHLLQVGGEEVAWRLVSLPPAGDVRVALTRRAGEDGDSIDVTVGRTRPVNDLLMSYLSTGDLVEARRLADAWHAADLALYEKLNDPVSAAAGAYALLKMKRLDERRDWVDNLVRWFPYLADGPIVAAALALQRADSNERIVRSYIAKALKRGMPVFSLGMSTLVETMAAVHRGSKEATLFHFQYQAARAYLQARTGRGPYFSFFGRSPQEPTWEPIRGPAGAPTERDGPPSAAQVPRLDLPRLSVGTSVKRMFPELFRTTTDRPGAQPHADNVAYAPFSRRTLDLRVGVPVASNWNAQRARNAFTVFDGDE